MDRRDYEMLSINRDSWIKNTTAGFFGRRNDNLTRLDDAIGTGREGPARIALSDWIGIEVAAGRDWRRHERNDTRSFEKLYNELQLAEGVRPLIEELVSITVACRADSRVLQPMNEHVLVVEPTVKLWIDYGFEAIIREDTVSCGTFYTVTAKWGEALRARTTTSIIAAAARAVPKGLKWHDTVSFTDWSKKVWGSCCQSASHDSALWAESIALHGGVPWEFYKRRIEAAHVQGDREQDAFEAEKFRRLQAASVIKKPSFRFEEGKEHQVKLYLKEFIRINSANPDTSGLKKAFEEARVEIMIVLGCEDEDPDAIKWDEARHFRREH